MNKLTPLEIVQVFSAYPLCPVQIFDEVESEKDGVKRYSNNSVGDYLQGVCFLPPYNIMCEHAKFDPELVKLVLKPIHHMSDNDVFQLCRAYENFPLAGSVRGDWYVNRRDDCIKVANRREPYTYEIEFLSGNITLYRDAKVSKLGNMHFATQWYLKNWFAIPLYFEPGHECNGKTAIDLGIAIPNIKLLNSILYEMLENDNNMVAAWHFDKKLLGIDLTNLATLDNAIKEIKDQLCG